MGETQGVGETRWGGQGQRGRLWRPSTGGEEARFERPTGCGGSLKEEEKQGWGKVRGVLKGLKADSLPLLDVIPCCSRCCERSWGTWHLEESVPSWQVYAECK